MCTTASVCVCVHTSVHRKLNVRTRLDAKNFCVQMRLSFKDFWDVLYMNSLFVYITVTSHLVDAHTPAASPKQL